MPGKKGSSWDATARELGEDGFVPSRKRVAPSAGFEADPEDEPIESDLDEDEELDDEDFDDEDDYDDEDDLDDDEDDDLDDDLIDLDDEFDEGPEEEVRPQHPGRYDD